MTRQAKKPLGSQRVKVYIHYGDLNHQPSQTVYADCTRLELKKLMQETTRQKWPARVRFVQIEGLTEEETQKLFPRLIGASGFVNSMTYRKR